MKVIGLTGGIGTGKSAVSRLLRKKGVTVIDADEATRAVQSRGTDGLRRLVEEFGPSILAPDGELDRARLARHVIENTGTLDDLRARTDEVWSEVTDTA